MTSTPLTPETRAALEATLVLAQQRHTEALKQVSKYGELYEEAAREESAALQTVLALQATLAEPAPREPARGRTFGEI